MLEIPYQRRPMQRRNPYLPCAIRSILRQMVVVHHHLRMGRMVVKQSAATEAVDLRFCETIEVKTPLEQFFDSVL